MEFALCQFDLMEMIGAEVEIQRKRKNVILELDELINNQKRVYQFYEYELFMNLYKTGLIFLWCDYLDNISAGDGYCPIQDFLTIVESWDEEIAEDDPNYESNLHFIIDEV